MYGKRQETVKRRLQELSTNRQTKNQRLIVIKTQEVVRNTDLEEDAPITQSQEELSLSLS